MAQLIYSFGDKKHNNAPNPARARRLLGEKGENLSTLSEIGVHVPSGFIISSKFWHKDLLADQNPLTPLKDDLAQAFKNLEEATDLGFNQERKPLLVSLRVSSQKKIPGLMETVLNIGLNAKNVAYFAKNESRAVFAYDIYRRLIERFSDAVMGVPSYLYEDLLEVIEDEFGTKVGRFSASQLKECAERFEALYQAETGEQFPQDANEQFELAVKAAYKSWQSPRAETYCALHNIDHSQGPALIVQSMVHGSRDERSVSGVLFTRHPKTGEDKLFGQYLPKAMDTSFSDNMSADYAAAKPISIVASAEDHINKSAFENFDNGAYKKLQEVACLIEKRFKAPHQLEFVLERGQLWVLQSRKTKVGSSANMKINVDMANQGIHTKGEALLNIEPDSLVRFLHPTIDPKAKVEVLASGLAASPGAASGQIVFSSSEAEKLHKNENLPLILVREETIPEDVHGMGASNGILTVRGGMSSHAAVIARGMGKPCVCGVSSARVDMENGTLEIGGRLLKSGETITIDGTNGQIFAGEVAKRQPKLSGDFATIMQWADEIRRMRVRCNAETPTDCKAALEFGAEGIGLCRTEHMFFDEKRIMVMREMILSDDEEVRREVLERLLPMQRSDFEQLFELMPGMPVTIRLLDPPLHEFLPKGDDEIIRIAKAMGIEEERLRARVHALSEANPMLGHRGCRLAISHPEIPEMQARAIFEAAISSAEKTGKPVVPEIMVPLISMREELEYIKQRIDWVAQDVMVESGAKIDYLVGSMIELPRAAIRARNIAEFSEFFSFGTNDLTQTTFGFSRDDAGSFLPTYQKKNILSHDPFASIDFQGVGELIEMAAERGRQTRPDIKLGICGEHGGDPASIEFCDAQGLEYVSCSPYRVPIARLSAAQATLRNKSR